MPDAEHTIAAELLAAYLGADVGHRVHAGVVERGSVESIRAVLWYADIRGFTSIADATPGPVLVDMLDDVFEALTAALRPRGAQVLKFLGDGMLASFAFVDATRDETGGRALDAAAEAMRNLDRLNTDRGAESGSGITLWSISRFISARGTLWQRRRRRSSRLCGHRAGGQRGRSDRDLVRVVSAQGSCLGRTRRRD